MILVQDPPRPPQIQVVLGMAGPGQLEDEVEAGAYHLVLGRRGRDRLQAGEFTLGLAADLVRQLCLLETPPDL